MAESDIPRTDGTKGEAAASPKAHKPRQNRLKGFLTALKYVHQAAVTNGVQQRFSDFVSYGLVIVCVLSLVAAVALPVPVGIRLLPLLLTVGAVIFYIINRLGILLSLGQRQALIVWQILIASFWLGVTSAMMVMMTCFYYFSQGAG